MVLKLVPYRERDVIVHAFVEGVGRISGLARGARGSRRRFAGALTSCVLIDLDMVPPRRGELWELRSATQVASWDGLAADVVALGHASYAIELIEVLVPPEVPEPGLLDALLEVWTSLRGGPSPAVLRWFETRVLQLSGIDPALERCARCGRAIAPEREVGFDPRHGGVACGECAETRQIATPRRLSAAARRYLVEVAGTPSASQARALDDGIATPDRHQARDAMLATIELATPRPLRSLEFLAKLGARSVSRPR